MNEREGSFGDERLPGAFRPAASLRESRRSVADPTIRLSTCRGTSCPECGKDVPSWGGLLPSLCGCRVCCSGCFSAHERKLLIEALRQRDLQTDHLAELRVKHQQERDAAANLFRARADRAEALLWDAARWIELEAGFSLSVTIREKASALLAKIREALKS